LEALLLLHSMLVTSNSNAGCKTRHAMMRLVIFHRSSYKYEVIYNNNTQPIRIIVAPIS